jgi:DNA polymerase-3 subunit epsilon
MKWWPFSRTPTLPPDLASRLHRWRQIPRGAQTQALARTRFVVVDVETTGLNPERDALLSIGAVTVKNLKIDCGKNFYCVVAHRYALPPDKQTLLVHGLSPTAQAQGQDPAQALISFLEYIGKDPLVAFHAGFDAAMVTHTLRETLAAALPNPWLDLAFLGPAVVPVRRLSQAGLDEWLAYFRLGILNRHHALSDAFATAELFLALLQRARAQGLGTPSKLGAAIDEQKRKTYGSAGGGA